MDQTPASVFGPVLSFHTRNAKKDDVDVDAEDDDDDDGDPVGSCGTTSACMRPLSLRCCTLRLVFLLGLCCALRHATTLARTHTRKEKKKRSAQTYMHRYRCTYTYTHRHRQALSLSLSPRLVSFSTLSCFASVDSVDRKTNPQRVCSPRFQPLCNP